MYMYMLMYMYMVMYMYMDMDMVMYMYMYMYVYMYMYMAMYMYMYMDMDMVMYMYMYKTCFYIIFEHFSWTCYKTTIFLPSEGAISDCFQPFPLGHLWTFKNKTALCGNVFF